MNDFRWVLVFGVLFATTARAQCLAEVELHLVRIDRKAENAYAIVDSVWDATRRLNVTRLGLSVDCALPGDQDWYARIRQGDTLRFKLYKQGGFRLSVPREGWPLQCRCNSRARVRVAHAAFVRGVDLDDSVRLPGYFGPRLIRALRVRLAWRGAELADAPEAVADPPPGIPSRPRIAGRGL